MNVRDSVRFLNMTSDEQAVVKMWLALGLNIEVRGEPTSSNWVPHADLFRGKQPWVVGSWYYRLKP